MSILLNLGEDPFTDALIRIKEIHDKKRADYSEKTNRFSNFEYAAKAANTTPHQAFEILIGVKQARLIELTQPGRIAKNESLEDTLLDRAVYSVLVYAYFILNDRAPK